MRILIGIAALLACTGLAEAQCQGTAPQCAGNSGCSGARTARRVTYVVIHPAAVCPAPQVVQPPQAAPKPTPVKPEAVPPPVAQAPACATVGVAAGGSCGLLARRHERLAERHVRLADRPRRGLFRGGCGG
jgi:hypothetical protein